MSEYRGYKGRGPQEAARGAVSRISTIVDDAEKQARKIREATEDLAAVRGTCASPNRAVSVTVDAAGRVVGLDLTWAAMNMQARDLSAVILDCIKKAQADAGRRVSRLAAGTWGEGSDLAERMRRAYPAGSQGHEVSWDGRDAPGAGRRQFGALHITPDGPEYI
ncbi:YbaB/EbfC family nucleoid-associated protein [Actinomyces sp. 2119]|uniref:YbaB/EbfC family nucleoid-associated protein n=1 Tax=Actinomyces sp. 2119 TaxID=2321393 RepID=UPI001602E8CD|nr:YbaB/EbfC family nucleoid-associated protein [Actinomyces sp. 2119]